LAAVTFISLRMSFPFKNTGNSIMRTLCNDHVIGESRCEHNGIIGYCRGRYVCCILVL